MSKCKQHPTYQGKRVPRSDCPNCLAIFKEANPSISGSVDLDLIAGQHKEEIKGVERKYRELINRYRDLEKVVEAVKSLEQDPEVTEILPKKGTNTSEAVAVVVYGDWHAEEKVDPETVNGLNSYDLATFDARYKYCFQNSLRLIEMNQQEVCIDTIIIALLGDFISNYLHEELQEINVLPPTKALLLVRNALVSGIDMFLKQTNCNLIIPCCCGNHGRFTKLKRHANQTGTSLEFLLYNMLALHYQALNEKRVKFIIPESYLAYVQVYDQVLRFHHGDGIKYHGGVGGITIPLNKAIAQWNKAKHANLDVIGHWHQLRDGGNYVCNGSMIGYNAYALSIKADFEKPRQAFFLMDRDRGKTINGPIFLERVQRKRGGR
ncbi:MAG: hypothetical protein WC473_03225 [Patescibacteria group bacterium]